ncbi:MAG: hypothetical protein EA405_02985 [Rhodospirillales bacterium]|nr:MAG: hypothetical protein EA405_02985 [Rhodospirillales bacterium]
MAIDEDAEPGAVSAWPATALSALGCWYTPREMAELGLDLRLCGVLNDVEYALLAFQADLHPDFATTVGALTGERPMPDRPRDYLALWQQRLAFERRRREPDHTLIQHILRIVMVLRRLAAPVHPAP